MNVTITVEGRVRRYGGDYDKVHNVDCSAVIQSMLDDEQEQGQEITAESVLDRPLNKFLNHK